MGKSANIGYAYSKFPSCETCERQWLNSKKTMPVKTYVGHVQIGMCVQKMA